MFLRTAVVVLALTVCAPLASFAGPLLVSVTPDSWTVQNTDGTSNTLTFGENTTYTLCLPRTVTGGFTDGTSNTLLFGEAAGVRLVWTSRFGGITDGTSNTITFSESSPLECFQGSGNPQPVIDEINDGTSNTILFGEDPFALGTEGFDACFSGVTVAINDGTSNTLLLGESRCLRDVRVSDNIRVQAPAPPVTALLALAASAWRFRRRSTRLKNGSNASRS